MQLKKIKSIFIFLFLVFLLLLFIFGIELNEELRMHLLEFYILQIR